MKISFPSCALAVAAALIGGSAIPNNLCDPIPNALVCQQNQPTIVADLSASARCICGLKSLEEFTAGATRILMPIHCAPADGPLAAFNESSNLSPQMDLDDDDDDSPDQDAVLLSAPQPSPSLRESFMRSTTLSFNSVLQQRIKPPP